jgi:uncharacterized protein (DUF169 family)
MSDYADLSSALIQLLHLSRPPIGIAFRYTAGEVASAERFHSKPPPPTPDGRTGAVAAGCVFWLKATENSFSTTAEDHGNCSVGSYTHGFRALEEVADKADMAALFESGWVTAADIPKIARIKQRPESVIYGPVADLPIAPDVVFMWMSAKQAMILDDALGGVRFEGKPQCHIIAIAKEEGVPAISVGCMLSRVRTGMSNNEMTCAIPATRLQHVVDALRRNAATERSVAGYAAADAARFA